tara:strand:+ start:46368 stop:48278 length:1911 start_codon:yes stop_codon:yes gene_type:complete
MTDALPAGDGEVQARILIVEKRSTFSYLVSVPWRIMGWAVLVLDDQRAATPGMGRWLRGDHVASRHVAYGFDCRAFHFVLAEMTNAILDRPFAEQITTALAPMVGDGIKYRNRFRIALFKSLRDELHSYARLVTVARHLKGQPKVRILPQPTPELSLALLCRADGDGPVAARRLITVAGVVMAAAAAPAKLLRRILPARLSGTPAETDKGASMAPDIPVTHSAGFSGTLGDLGARVVMFTHWGPRYGDLFEIDYYYRPEPDHPLNSQRILFLEHSDSAVESFQFLNGVSAHLLDNFRRTAARLFQAGLFPPGLRQLLFLLTAFKKVLLVDRYRRALARLTNARLAIVGYDILCPTELVIAAQNQGITCIALQERFNSLFSPIHALVLDRYFVFGEAASEALARHRNVDVGESRPIGPIRSDWIADRENRASLAPDGRRKVLILDAHSSAHQASPDTLEVNSWENNALFLDHAIRLATAFPDHDFIVRGKDAAWMDNAYFADHVAKIAGLKNMTVDRTFDKWRRSYELIDRSDLIVARYTSLGDEALAKGVPVIFHEDTVTGRTYQRMLCDYEGYPVFSDCYTSLEEAVGKVLGGGRLMRPDESRRFRKRFYCADAPGPVAARLMAAIDDTLDMPAQ